MSVEEIRKYKNLLESILTEAQNYEDMFNDVRRAIGDSPELHLSTVDKVINNTIKNAKAKLQKKDRIVWFLRQWKIGFLAVLLDNLTTVTVDDRLADDNPLVVGLREVLIKSMETLKTRGGKVGIATDYIGLHSRANEVLTKFEHMFSLPIPQIQNYKFEFQNIDDVYRQFKKWEDDWQKQAKELIPYDPNDGEAVLSFNDGFAWYNLNKEYCRKEGAAMGHCGNTAAYKAGDRVLSLRKKVKVGNTLYVRPSLTFILHSNGYLGEMKGRANNKPDAKYHNYIVSLLRLPIIKGISGGGYAPQNNFELSDLDSNTYEALIEDKPTLDTLANYYNKHGLDEHVLYSIKETFPDITITEDKKYAILGDYNNIEQLIDNYGDRTATYILEYINGTTQLDVDIPIDAADEFIKNLPREVLYKIGIYVEKTYPTEIKQWEERFYNRFKMNSVKFDNKDGADIASILATVDDPIYDNARLAYHSSVESGTISDMTDSLIDAVSHPIEGTNGISIIIRFDNAENKFQFDSEITLLVSMDDIINRVILRDDIEYIHDYGWFEDFKIAPHEPQNGFEGYDPDSGMELFYNEHPEFKVDEQSKPFVPWR